MPAKITAETLSLTTYNHIPIITTELLAQLYGAEAGRVRKNYHRNSDRFVCGKHFYKVTGSELDVLRMSLRHSQNPVSPKVRSLILWTERGAARHAKMLETDQAWEVFEKLEDCYFNMKEHSPITPSLSLHGRLIMNIENGIITSSQPVPDNWIFGTTDTFEGMLKQRGYHVIHESEINAFVRERINSFLDTPRIEKH